MGIEIIKYEDQFQLGITTCIHDTGNGIHYETLPGVEV